jgi:hypothetical protein
MDVIPPSPSCACLPGATSPARAGTGRGGGRDQSGDVDGVAARRRGGEAGCGCGRRRTGCRGKSFQVGFQSVGDGGARSGAVAAQDVGKPPVAVHLLFGVGRFDAAVGVRGQGIAGTQRDGGGGVLGGGKQSDGTPVAASASTLPVARARSGGLWPALA